MVLSCAVYYTSSLERMFPPTLLLHCGMPAIYHLRFPATRVQSTTINSRTIYCSPVLRCSDILVEIASGDVARLEIWGYPAAKKCDNIFSRFDTIPDCDRQTGGQSDIFCQYAL